MYPMKNLRPEYLKNSSKFKNLKNKTFTKGEKVLKTFHQRNTQVANKHMKRSPKSFFREMQVKTTMKCHFISDRMSIIQRTDNSHVMARMGRNKSLHTLLL